MEMSENMTELGVALSKFQGEVNNVSKDKSGYGYKYADLAQILDVVRPLLSKHGLSVIQMPGKSESGVTVSTMILHSSGQWIKSETQLPMETAAKMSAAQAAGSVITYARRYALAAALGIAQEDDDAAKPESGYAVANKVVAASQASTKKAAPASTPANNAMQVSEGKNWKQFCSAAKAKFETLATGGQLRAWAEENDDHLQTLAVQDNALYQDVLAAWKARKTYVDNHPQPAVTTGTEPDPKPADVLADLKKKAGVSDDDEIPF
jgi:hypothetical protein